MARHVFFMEAVTSLLVDLTWSAARRSNQAGIFRQDKNIRQCGFCFRNNTLPPLAR